LPERARPDIVVGKSIWRTSAGPTLFPAPERGHLCLLRVVCGPVNWWRA